MPKVSKHRKKGLRRDKKARSPSKQPICGLYAAAKCANIQLKSAADVEAFRQTCFEHGLLSQRNRNWVGGTTYDERTRICEHFGCIVSPSHHELLSNNTQHAQITVKSLLKNTLFFKTKGQYMLEIYNHVLWVRSNGTKKALRVTDQRGKLMRLVNANKVPDAGLEPLLRQHVVSLVLVSTPAGQMLNNQ